MRMRGRLAAEEKKFSAAPAAVKQRHGLQGSDSALQFPSKTRITAPRLKKESRNMLLQLAALLSKSHFCFVEAKSLYIEVFPILTGTKHSFSNFLTVI